MAIIPNDISRVLTVLGNDAQNSAKYDVSANDAARQLGRRTFHVETAALSAGTALLASAAPALYVPRRGRVIECKFFPHAGATEHAANYARGQINKLPGNGTVGSAIATFDTRPVASGGVGSLVAATTVTAPINQVEEDFLGGTWLAPSVAHVGTGVAFPAGTWAICIEWQGVDSVPV